MIWLKRFGNLLRIISGYTVSRITHRVVHWGKPLAVSIEPTNHCNLFCPECPAGLRELTRPRGYMDQTLFRSIIDQLSPHLTYLTLYFQGEPFLDPVFFENIKYARSRNIYVSSSTNGHFLTPANVSALIHSGLNRLVISVDGTDQSTYARYRIGGSLEKVLEGIRNLVDTRKKMKTRNPSIIIQFLVLKINQHQISEIKKLGKKLGVDKVELKTAQFYDYLYGNPLMTDLPEHSRYIPASSPTHQLTSTPVHQLTSSPTHQLKNHLPDACFRMWSSCVFTWDGKVVPCCFDKDARYILGNMHNQSFQQIWRSQDYHHFRKKILDNRKSIDICTNCTQTF